jgi:nicotinamide mononucleotide transporter
MNLLEAAGVLFGIVSVWLSVKENIWSWPTAIVNVAIYFVVFYQQKLYADMGLQVFYAAISVYGWYHWLFGGAQRSTLTVSRTPRALAVALPVLWVAGFLVLGAVLQRTTDAAIPFADSALTVGSLLAQWMMSRKYLENWAVWVVLDVAYVAMFAMRGLPLTAFLYAVYLVLAARGHVEWSRTLSRQSPLPSVAS